MIEYSVREMLCKPPCVIGLGFCVDKIDYFINFLLINFLLITTKMGKQADLKDKISSNLIMNNIVISKNFKIWFKMGTSNFNDCLSKFWAASLI